MKRLFFVFVTLFCMVFSSQAQNNVGINDDNSAPKVSAMLDVYSTTKGLLIPRIALTFTTVAAPVTTPETSLIVYNTATAGDVIPGYYYWDSSKWMRLQSTGTGIQKLSTVTKTVSGAIAKTDNMVFASGDITLTLPAVISADNGLEISVKNSGTYMDLVTVTGATGSVFIDGSISSLLYKNWGRTYVAKDGNWVRRENVSRADNVFDVSAKSSWTTIAEVVEFLGSHMTGPSIVQLGGGTYTIAATQTINRPYPLTFQGMSYGETKIVAAAGVSGSPLFICQTDCYFKMLDFTAVSNTAGNDGLRFPTNGTYHEIKDCSFTGFNKGIVSTNAHSLLWIFEVSFLNCAGAGIEIAAGTNSGGALKVSECLFEQCAVGINLLSGIAGTISIYNSNFYNTTSGTDVGIKYTPATFTSSPSMFISSNAWNNQGTYMSGFDFSRTDGRDANAFLMNNLGMENENPHFKITLLNNTTAVAANGSTWIKANWNTSATYLTTYTCKWDLSSTVNRFKYLPNNKSDVIMWISGNIYTNQDDKTINVAICKGGVTTTRYGETTLRTAIKDLPYQFSTVVYLPDTGPNDYFELWFSSASGGSQNIIFSDLNWFTDAH